MIDPDSGDVLGLLPAGRVRYDMLAYQPGVLSIDMYCQQAEIATR